MRALKIVEQIAEPEIAEAESWNGRIQMALLAPNGVQKLRELILELAMRGKLVPQSSKDESARDLLIRIKNEKEKLSKAGEVKKEKNVLPVTQNEGQFRIPKGWVWCRFADISSYIQRGKGPDYVEKSDYPVLSQKCVRWHGLDLSRARFISEKSLEKYDKIRFLKTGDVLWNSTGTGTIGRASVVPKIDKTQKLVVDSHVTIVRPVLINPEYLWRWIQSPTVQNEIEGNASGSTNQIELSTSTVIAHLIPLPPFEEQDRIVSKINELMVLCDRLEAQKVNAASAHEVLVKTLLGTLTQSQNAKELQENWQRIAQNFSILFTTDASIDALRQTILQLAIRGKLVEQSSQKNLKEDLAGLIRKERISLEKSGKIKEPKPFVDFAGLSELKRKIPDTWLWVRLADIADVVRGGSPRPAGDPKYYDGKIPFLKVADITGATGKFVEGFNATIKEAGLSKTRYITTRTVLFSNSGATLGIPAICDFNTAFNDGVAAFSELSDYVYDEYLYLYLSSLSRWYLEIASRGQGQPNLNTDIIKSTWFALPPLSEQHKIVTKVDELMAMCDALKRDISEFNSLHKQLATALVEKAVAA